MSEQAVHDRGLFRAIPSPAPRAKVTDTFCEDFLEKRACSRDGNCGKSHTQCHSSACRRTVKTKEGSATKVIIAEGCKGWHLAIRYSDLLADRAKAKDARLRRAAERREEDDFRDKIYNVIPGLNPANAAKTSTVANGNAANAGNVKRGPRQGGRTPPSTSKSKAASKEEAAPNREKGGWKKEDRKKWGNRAKKNSSQQTKKSSENALVEKILKRLEELEKKLTK